MISLAMPAIQASREAARRTQCTNNQHQFGVAFTNFEAQQHAFPAGFTFRLQGPLKDAKIQSNSFFAELLPYLEENAVAAQYHRDAHFCAAENSATIATVINVAVCPTTPRDELVVKNESIPSQWFAGSLNKTFGKFFSALDPKYSITYQGAVTDYGVPVRAAKLLALQLGYKIDINSETELRSVCPWPAGKKIAKDCASGSVAIREQTRAAQITDGLSNTFLMTEDAGRPQHWRNGVRSFVREPLTSSWADPLINITIRDPDGKDRTCVINCDNEANIYSFHPNGVNFLFADGHVIFLDDGIDPRLLLAYMTPDKGDNQE
jgi:prepilin-type processing-associated H-X9-DG protein